MASAAAAAIHAPGLAPDRLRRLADGTGLALWAGGPAWRKDGPPPAERVIVVLDDGTNLDDAQVWQIPNAAWIEVRGLSDPALERSVRRAGSADVFASFTTGTANRLHLASLVLDVLAARRPIPGAQRDDIELALHEAVSNAVVHGNLQVASMQDVSMASLERFSADMAQRMADPSFANRRIEVAAWAEATGVTIEVADEGEGFVPPDRRDDGPSGRGLSLIESIAESCELLDNGRRIRMRFAL